jgi:hypothetical protein
MDRKLFKRCYALAKEIYAILDAYEKAKRNSILERILDREFRKVDAELLKISRGEYWTFRNMVWDSLYTKNRYADGRWLQIRLDRTHIHARALRDKMRNMLEYIKYGEQEDIPF